MDAQQLRVSEPREFMHSSKVEVWGTKGQGRGGWGTVRVNGQELLTSSVSWRASLDLPQRGLGSSTAALPT